MKVLKEYITYEGKNFGESINDGIAQVEIIKLSEKLSSFTKDIFNSKTGFIDIKSNGAIEIEDFPDDLQNSIIDYLKISKDNHYTKP